MNIRKNKSYDGRIVGQINEHAGHTTLSGNSHSGFQILHYPVQWMSLGRLRGASSKPWLETRTLYTQRYDTQHQFSWRRRSTCDLQCASIILTTPDGVRRYGLDRCGSQMPCPLPYQISSPKGTRAGLWLLSGSMYGPHYLPESTPRTYGLSHGP
jgi:hypothetical protein